jgi:hypothetical protein
MGMAPVGTGDGGIVTNGPVLRRCDVTNGGQRTRTVAGRREWAARECEACGVTGNGAR